MAVCIKKDNFYANNEILLYMYVLSLKIHFTSYTVIIAVFLKNQWSENPGQWNIGRTYTNF